MENLVSKTKKIFNTTVLGGIVAGTQLIFLGKVVRNDLIEGVGYGMLAMSAIMPLVTYGSKYFLNKTPNLN